MFSLFYLFFLCKTGNLDINIKKSAIIFLCYDLFCGPFAYCCSFSSRMVNKMIDFSHEKVYVCRFRFEAYAQNEREKATKFSSKSEVLLDADGHLLT